MAKLYLTKAALQYKIAEADARLENLEVTEYARRKYNNRYEYREKHVTAGQFLDKMQGTISPELVGREPDLILPADNFVMNLRMAAVFAKEINV